MRPRFETLDKVLLSGIMNLSLGLIGWAPKITLAHVILLVLYFEVSVQMGETEATVSHGPSSLLSPLKALSLPLSTSSKMRSTRNLSGNCEDGVIKTIRMSLQPDRDSSFLPPVFKEISDIRATNQNQPRDHHEDLSLSFKAASIITYAS